MTTTDTKTGIKPVTKQITVPCDAKTAFDVFVRRISHWWPAAEHSVAAMSNGPAPTVMLEPEIGGTFLAIPQLPLP